MIPVLRPSTRSRRLRRSRRGRRRRGWTLLTSALAVVATAACTDDATAPDAPARYAVEVSGETFVVEVTSAAGIAGLEARLASGLPGVLVGTLAAGDGGHNSPWGWHLVPASVHAADAATEVCDGRPSFVEADLDYWLDAVGSFCPWGATVVARLEGAGS